MYVVVIESWADGNIFHRDEKPFRDIESAMEFAKQSKGLELGPTGIFGESMTVCPIMAPNIFDNGLLFV